MEVRFKGVRFKLITKVFLSLDINFKERTGQKTGLDWAKESWDNARVQINSALIVFTPCFNKSLCYFMITVNNFFDILKYFDFLNFHWYNSYLVFNFVTTFYIRKIKDEHRIFQTRNKEVGFSSQQHIQLLRCRYPTNFIALRPN